MGEATTTGDSARDLVDLSHYYKNITSTSGENGIIEKIFDVISPTHKVCVELGAFDLREASNTFPFWAECGWHGILIEGDKYAYRKIIEDFQDFRTESSFGGSLIILKEYVQASGRKTLDGILRAQDVPHDFDLLSLDIDGNEYQIWESLVLHQPRVVVVEFNPTIPPHLSFIGKGSGNNIGSGVLDLFRLGKSKGYDLVACTSFNALFVKTEEARDFSDRNDLEKLFNGRHLTYAISTYKGGLFFSRMPIYGYSLADDELRHVKHESAYWAPSGWYLLTFTLRQIVKRLLCRFPSAYALLRHLWRRRRHR